jgi:hypothetical protein
VKTFVNCYSPLHQFSEQEGEEYTLNSSYPAKENHFAELTEIVAFDFNHYLREINKLDL